MDHTFEYDEYNIEVCFMDTINKTINNKVVTFYVISIKNPLFQYEWQVERRFNDFYELRKNLSQFRLPEIPSKTLFNNQAIINERKIKLNNFISFCINNSDVRKNLLLKQFLEIDKHKLQITPHENKISSESGLEYIGSFDENYIPKGSGILKYPNGDKSEGNFIFGMKIWEGIHRKNGDSLIYIGKWSEDGYEGIKIQKENDSKFLINLKGSDLRNFGILLQGDGKKYVGVWESEKLKGLGYSVDLNGIRYMGNWENKEYDGFGIYEEKKKSNHIGYWKNSQKEGVGVSVDHEFRYEGLWEKDKKKLGTLFIGNMTKYEGEFVNDLFHGLGEMNSPDSLYQGEWNMGVKCGVGTLKNKIGVYEGMFEYDNIHGKGTLKYNSGEIYTGDWYMGLKHGNGVEIYADKSTFTGLWQEDKKTHGEFKSSKGETYVGEWQNNMMEGKGKFTFTDGKVFEGSFIKNKFSGSGVLKFPNGNCFVGEWLEGLPHGNGKEIILQDIVLIADWFKGYIVSEVTVHFPNKDIYRGELQKINPVSGYMLYSNLVNNKENINMIKPHGNGVMNYHYNSSKFKGSWQDGLKHGSGIYTDSHGFSFEEIWDKGHRNKGVLIIFYEGDLKYGLPDGSGVMTDWDGNVYKGQWKEGLCHGNGEVFYINDQVEFKGSFHYGLKNGQGRLKTSNDIVIKQEWENGNLNSQISKSQLSPNLVDSSIGTFHSIKKIKMLTVKSEKKLCELCCEQNAETIFAPCGHKYACIKCTEDLIKRKISCPMCRTKILSFITKIYE